jgi:hypothetical protein
MTRIGDLLDQEAPGPLEELARQAPMSPADIREAAVRHVLHKKASQESVLRRLFREHGASLIENAKLEGCSRRIAFDEDQFVRSYPYLPHLIDLFIDILTGLRAQSEVRGEIADERPLIRPVFDILMSSRTGLAQQPVGALVSIDRIYEMLKARIAPHKQRDVLEIGRRFEWDDDYPGMAARVARAICALEFVGTDLPRTTRNIAALLIQRVTEPPPTLAVAAILHHLKRTGLARESADGWRLCDHHALHRIASDLERLKNNVGVVNPRPSGWHNGPIQLAKKALARILAWYIRPVREFDASVTRSLEELVSAVDGLSVDLAEQFSRNWTDLQHLSMNVVALEGRIAMSEKRHANGAGGQPKTTYIIGLFGTGRRYINGLLLDTLGERVRYFRDTIRLHPGPTPMIYSGHATMKHLCRLQEPPAVMSAILQAVRSQFANAIFIYRHPLDSLLTNWVWWRSFLHDHRAISGISEVYPNVDDLCAELEGNFADFQSLAQGDPEFFASSPGPRFLSFAEYVEETELHLQAARVSLRLEDCTADPLKEFSKVAELISLDLNGNGARIEPPRSKPYGYLAVREKVPRFKGFIDGLDGATRGRIARMGYGIA